MKKSKFKGYIKSFEFDDIKKEISKLKEFSDFDAWRVRKLCVGEMHHTYVFEKGNKKYFVKEVKPHEAQVNYFLCKLNSYHLPHAVFPQLLKKKILIMPLLKGKMLRKRKISLSLLRDFIVFQNRMNKKSFFRENNPLKLNNFSQKDDDFLLTGLNKYWADGRKNLSSLKKKHKLAVIDRFLEILDFVSKDKKSIIKDFSKMPFARQHHDFREDNILVNNKGQFLLDWGSSYGYGPFMYDYSKFLVYDSRAFNLVMKKSDMCRKVSEKQAKRWLYVSLVVKMLNMLNWYIRPGHHNIETKKKVKKLLEYEYRTYKWLLNTL